MKFGPVDNARKIHVQIIRNGARSMPQVSLVDEVNDFLEMYPVNVNLDFGCMIVRNSYFLSREVVTGTGCLEIQQ